MNKTRFGQFLQILRIQSKDTASTMAKNLGITQSYLSKIEHGKRKIPVDFLPALVNIYQMDSSQQEEMYNAYICSIAERTLQLDSLSNSHKQTAELFMKTLKYCSEQHLIAIRKILENAIS